MAYRPISFGRPNGPLEILKAWNRGGEKQVLNRVLDLGLLDRGPEGFDFVPVGTNLDFDLGFLIERMILGGIRRFDAAEVLDIFREKPRIDIKTSLLLMNEGQFKGSGLDSFTRLKKAGGKEVLGLWEHKDYAAIEDYIRRDAAAFFEVYGKILPVLAKLGRELRQSGKSE